MDYTGPRSKTCPSLRPSSQTRTVSAGVDRFILWFWCWLGLSSTLLPLARSRPLCSKRLGFSACSVQQWRENSGEITGREQRFRESPSQPTSLAVIGPSVLGCSLWTAEPQNNIPINNELYTQPSHSMSPGDIIAFYGTVIHSMGITLSGGAGAQFLPGPGFAFPSAPFTAAL